MSIVETLHPSSTTPVVSDIFAGGTLTFQELFVACAPGMTGRSAPVTTRERVTP